MRRKISWTTEPWDVFKGNRNTVCSWERGYIQNNMGSICHEHTEEWSLGRANCKNCLVCLPSGNQTWIGKSKKSMEVCVTMKIIVDFPERNRSMSVNPKKKIPRNSHGILILIPPHLNAQRNNPPPSPCWRPLVLGRDRILAPAQWLGSHLLMKLYIHVYVYVYIYIYTCIYRYRYLNTYLYIYAYTYICIYIYI